MPTKRHNETLAASGERVAFTELKRLRAEGESERPAAIPPADPHMVVQHDHDIDRSETDDALKRAVDRASEKRGGGG